MTTLKNFFLGLAWFLGFTDFILIFYISVVIAVLPLFKIYYLISQEYILINLLISLAVLFYFIIIRWSGVESLILQSLLVIFSIFDFNGRSFALLIFWLALLYLNYLFTFIIDRYLLDYFNAYAGNLSFYKIFKFIMGEFTLVFIKIVSFLSNQILKLFLSISLSLKFFFILGFNPSIFFSSQFELNSVELACYYELTDAFSEYYISSFFSFGTYFLSLASIFHTRLFYFFVLGGVFILFSYLVKSLFLLFFSFYYLYIDSIVLSDFVNMSKIGLIFHIIFYLLMLLLLYIFVDSIRFNMSWPMEMYETYSSLVDNAYSEYNQEIEPNQENQENSDISLNKYVKVSFFLFLIFLGLYLNQG